jgi:hypothetical protein
VPFWAKGRLDDREVRDLVTWKPDRIDALSMGATTDARDAAPPSGLGS